MSKQAKRKGNGEWKNLYYVGYWIYACGLLAKFSITENSIEIYQVDFDLQLLIRESVILVEPLRFSVDFSVMKCYASLAKTTSVDNKLEIRILFR